MIYPNHGEKPADVLDWQCKLCGAPMRVTYHWFCPSDYLEGGWVHPLVHDKCARDWERKHASDVMIEQEMPERFANFELAKFDDEKALIAAENFGPDSKYRCLALIGSTGTGKSRLMWQVIKGFFNQMLLETGMASWVEYHLFSELMTEYDRKELGKIKEGRYVFIDDIGSTQAGGAQRVELQNLIRTRVQRQAWTFLTIDDPSFDPGFKDLFRERAIALYVGDE